MYCGNCGTQNDDFSPFCIGCGARLNEDPAPVAPAPAPKKSKKGLLIAIIAAVVAVAVALVLIFTISTPKSVVKKYMDAYLDPDGKAMLSVIPKAVVKEDIGDKDDQKDYVEEMEDTLDELYDEMDDYYDRWSIDYKISDVEKVDKDDLEEIQEYYEDEYDIKVRAAKEVTVDVTVKVDGDKEKVEMTIYVIKVGGKWYIDVIESDNPIYVVLQMFY